MSDLTHIHKAADEVRAHYDQLFCRASGVEQEIYGDVRDAFELFCRSLARPIEVQSSELPPLARTP